MVRRLNGIVYAANANRRWNAAVEERNSSNLNVPAPIGLFSNLPDIHEVLGKGHNLKLRQSNDAMKLFHRTIVLVLASALLATVGCFSYHSTKVAAEPTSPSETTSTTTTHTDNGLAQQRTTTTSTYPSY
jgi:hypothetical protein